MNQIIRYGKVVRPTLGINVVDDRIVQSISMQLGRRLDGVLIAEVLENSPALRAGLKASQMAGDGSISLGDLITSVDGSPVRQVEDLLSSIEEKHDGDTVRLTVQPNCNPSLEKVVSATLVSREKLRGGVSSYTDRGSGRSFGGRGRNGANQVSTDGRG